MFTLHATGVGSGIAIGTARVILRPGQDVPEYDIEPEQVEQEIRRLARAFDAAIESMHNVMDELPEDAPEDIGSFLATHLLILQDPVLNEEPAGIIRERLVNAEAALAMHARHLEQVFSEIDDPYLSSKSIDVAQVVNRLQGELLDDRGELSNQPEGKFDGEIIVANDLTPADTVDLKRHQISAFVTNLGGPISHTAILARSMRIPAIVGLHGATRYLRTGDLLVIDGKRGIVLVNPDAAALESYQRRREKIVRRIQALDALRDAPASTLDGHPVSLFTNIELPDEIAQSISQNAQGVGLYRTEFLFMNRDELPREEEQFEVYAGVVSQVDHPVTIRTLDLGADKQVDGGRPSDTMSINPALGRRAIRLCLHDLALFKPQLRAIYRASVFGELRLMVPMLSSMEELSQLFVLLEQVKNELVQEGHAINPDVPVGGMIEVPAAAIAADLFAHRLDFLSIGTNDLIQYTLAIDRIDDAVNYLYDPLHPSVLRLVKMTIDAGAAAGIPVSMCGEMAGDPLYTRVLLGMGLREFSMDPAAILEIKRQIRLSDVSRIEPRVDEMLKTPDPDRIKQLVTEING